MNILDKTNYLLPPDTHLLFVEGINGSGKTTFVRNFIENNHQYERIITYRGKGIHPVDLSRTACFTENDFSNFLDMLYLEGIQTPDQYVANYVTKEENYFLVDYLPVISKINDKSQSLDFAHSHELYDGFSTPEIFCSTHIKRWMRFGQRNFTEDTLAIFEAVTMQYPLMELIAYKNLSKEQILSYIKSCVESVRSWNPLLIYLDVGNIEKNLLIISKERGQSSDWLENFKKWISHSPSFSFNDNDGITGVIEFLKRRREIEHYIMDHLDIPVRIITREDLR